MWRECDLVLAPLSVDTLRLSFCEGWENCELDRVLVP